ncbi:MAG: glutamine-hydrolyzing carbamoyl-phosphate synthase small subunit [Euryarchaeota archaeon]|nr:glutamine-hydrolyzing carbamoyl-phosphate synthase small subunit [Euryarchaeota archaeon]
MDRERALVLDDGTVARGRAFGAERSVFGELVFNTGMTGYQEALTDPSYNGQLLMMTYPLIGNYGVSEAASESSGIKAEAFVVREHCERPSHRESRMTLDAFLRDAGIAGISGVDTRWLTLKTRERGTMRAGIVEADAAEEALGKVRTMPYPDAQNLVGEVSTARAVTLPFRGPGTGDAPRVVAVDCGIKRSILQNLNSFAEVVQVPYSATAEDIMALRPDGVLVSNGPGDPAHPAVMSTTVRTVRGLAGKVPLMGICLGHQMIALAFGGRTFKLKFGHRGANQPVREERTRKVVITSQNHGFAVHPDLPSELELSELNVNDGTVEALRHRELPVFSVQYHPEASPGPRDARFIFGQFQRLVSAHRGGG